MKSRSAQDDGFDRRAGLRREAERCRELWASVVLAELARVSLEFKKLMREERATVAAHVLGNLRRWMVSRDGRECLELAGINYSDRVVQKIVEKVEAGTLVRADYYQRPAK